MSLELFQILVVTKLLIKTSEFNGASSGKRPVNVAMNSYLVYQISFGGGGRGKGTEGGKNGRRNREQFMLLPPFSKNSVEFVLTFLIQK